MDSNNGQLLEAARGYLRRGWMPVYVPSGSKGPIQKGWQTLRLSEDELPTHFNRPGNIGLILGEPSGGLTDVDLDSAEAGELADQYLPSTAAITGRPSSLRSHRWYISDLPSTRQFRDPHTGEMIVELRSTGGQTLVGPSIHQSGETYDLLEGEPTTVPAEQLIACVLALFEAVMERRYGVKPRSNLILSPLPPSSDFIEQRAIAYLNAMSPAISGQGGHNATYAAATALVHGFGISPDHALQLLLTYYNPRCQPPWTEKELRHKVDDATRKPHSRPFGWLRDCDPALGVDLSGLGPNQISEGLGIEPVSVMDLVQRYPALRDPVIHGLLRRGETMNVISAPKVGKSWLVTGLALSIATGNDWLDTFPTEPGNVLILDNELHSETSAHRIPRVAEAKGIAMSQYGARVFVLNLRGKLQDVFSLDAFFKQIQPGQFKVIILDAFYRFMPRDMDENDNGTMANIYNHIDRYADQLDCAFILIHHTTKGNQSAKSVTDVGAGAGSQSRAADTHLILRPHEEMDAYVLEVATRSWAPLKPFVLRWTFPIWTLAPDLDPVRLRNEKRKEKDSVQADWAVEDFVAAFVKAEISPREVIIGNARVAGLTAWRATCLLREAEARGLIHRHSKSRNRLSGYSILPASEVCERGELNA